MNIRQKMLLGAAALTLVPVVITAALLWRGASNLSADTVTSLTQSQLVSLRDTKRQQVTDDIQNRVRTLQSLAGQRSMVDGIKALKAGFYSAGKDTGIAPDAAATTLTDYVQKQFAPEFARRNVGAADVSKALAALDANALALQTEFIVNNPNPLGQKEKMVRPNGNYPYAQAHATYHPALERTQKLTEVYDIFFIDTDTDTVIYSVFKELDFATQLKGNAIAAGSKLAEAYEKVKKAPNADAVALSDFATYVPSYNDQAAFAAAPVFDGERQIGVIAVQFPIDKISLVMSSNQGWKQIGL